MAAATDAWLNTPRFYLMLPDDALYLRLTRALQENFAGSTWVRPASWDELQRSSNASLPDLVIFDPGAETSVNTRICEFREAFASVPLIAYSRSCVLPARSWLELAHLGVGTAFTYDVDDGQAAIAKEIEELLHGESNEAIYQLLVGRVPREFHGCLRFIWDRVGRDRLDCESVARYAYCHPKTLRDRFARAGLPPPNRLIIWCKLLRAAQLLRGRKRSIASVAHAVGYETSAALYRQLHQHGGVRPSDLWAPQGVGKLLCHIEAQWDVRNPVIDISPS